MTKQQQPDPQLDTASTGHLFEVLSVQPNGHRTIHRVTAKDRTAAEKQVTDGLATGQVIGATAAGAGPGSGDAASR